ncbi:MAG: hypothetical protein NTW11_02965 [Candidatus Staskawiczbacteria bacterium]|nr:hypothetical protein [Candidatus Staskawiczbacteria bacterium]
MTKITEKQLIESLRQLKEIKPNREWASLLKTTLLENKVPGRMTGTVLAKKVSFAETLRFIFTPRKLVYAFSVVLLFVVGTFGIIKSLPVEKAPQQQATLTNQTAVAIKEQINETVKNLAQNLKDNPVQTPQTMKVLVKTLADMPGDMTDNQDVKGLMQTVVEGQVADLQKATLTNEQKITLTQVENLYNQEKYSEALEAILLINN